MSLSYDASCPRVLEKEGDERRISLPHRYRENERGEKDTPKRRLDERKAHLSYIIHTGVTALHPHSFRASRGTYELAPGNPDSPRDDHYASFSAHTQANSSFFCALFCLFYWFSFHTYSLSKFFVFFFPCFFNTSEFIDWLIYAFRFSSFRVWFMPQSHAEWINVNVIIRLNELVLNSRLFIASYLRIFI